LTFLLKTEFSVTYSTEEFLQNNNSDLLKHLIASDLSMALPEVKSNLPLITIPTTGVSVKCLFFALCMLHTDSGETR
jgi:hypothetical protein